MDGIILSDAYFKLKEEIQKLQMIAAALTSERDDLRYHVCPELESRYAEEIGEYENRINYQKLMILEIKRRIEIARAALNREKTVSQEEVDKQVHKEYKEFHEKVDEARRKAEQAKRGQREREERQREYEEKWKKRYGGGETGEPGGDGAEGTGPKGNGTGSSGDTGDDGQGNTGDGGNKSGGKGNKVPNIKELYRKIVKKLHPDANPDITKYELELFYKAQKAYEDGDVVTLQEIYDEIFGDGTAEEVKKELTYEELVELKEKLEERIRHLQAEIENIRKNYPYTLKEFLDDAEAVRKRREELEEQIHLNEETLKRLTKILEDINQEMEELRRKQNSKKK